MSLHGALRSAISGLNAQSAAMTAVSNNLANSDTCGYKAQGTSFSNLVTAQSMGEQAYASSGVRSTAVQHTSQQGQIESTNTTTNVALSGNGLFATTKGLNGNTLCYTRNGEFGVDKGGYLVNRGYYLQGWALDHGKYKGSANSAANLSPVNVSRFSSSAAATEKVSISANLPADAKKGDTFGTDVKVYDSQGNAHTVKATWKKTDDNKWTASFKDSNGNDIPGGTVGITFKEDGTFDHCEPDPPKITPDWNNGSAKKDIKMDLTGLTQYASGNKTPKVAINNINQDGLSYGAMDRVNIKQDGTVVAHYTNGASVSIYKIPVATVPNYDGLSLNKDGFYEESPRSGSATLHEAGNGSAGTVSGSSLESSTVDTAEEFSRMIVSQKAYSAAAQMVTTVNGMYDTLISAVR